MGPAPCRFLDFVPPKNTPWNIAQKPKAQTTKSNGGAVERSVGVAVAVFLFQEHSHGGDQNGLVGRYFPSRVITARDPPSGSSTFLMSSLELMALMMPSPNCS